MKRQACFEEACRSYELSVPGVPQEDQAKLRKNLMTTQLRLAQCAAESGHQNAAEMVRHHLDQAVEQARFRSQLLCDEGSWDSLLTSWLKIDMEPAAIPFDLRMLAYRFLRNIPGATSSSMALRAASCLLKKAVTVTAGSSYDEAIVAASKGLLRNDPASRLVWTRCQQHLNEACQWLSCPGVSTAQDYENPSLAFEEIRQQVEFLSHRSAGVLQLCAALQLRAQVLQESEDFSLDGMLEELDGLVRAIRVCEMDGDSHPILNGGASDVELVCVGLSYLGSFYQQTGMQQQARKRFYDCVRLALTTQTETWDEEKVISGSPPPGQIYQKAWFRQATKFLRADQADKLKKLDEERARRLTVIQAEVEELHKANQQGLEELTSFLTRRFPRKTLEPMRQPFDKKPFFAFQVAYSPDKQHEGREGSGFPPGWKHGFQAWLDFCTEVAKTLNYHYEVLFKSQEPQEPVIGLQTEGQEEVMEAVTPLRV